MTTTAGRAVRPAAILLATCLAMVPALAQQRAPEAPRALTSADYARAEKFMTYNTSPLLLRAGVQPTWLDDERFWYSVTGAGGREAVLVDPVAKTKTPCELPACKGAERATPGVHPQGAKPNRLGLALS